jgi:hypothetical protein
MNNKSNSASEVLRLLPYLKDEDLQTVLGAVQFRINSRGVCGTSKSSSPPKVRPWKGSGRGPKGRGKPKGPQPNILPDELKSSEEYVSFKSKEKEMKAYLKENKLSLKEVSIKRSQDKPLPESVLSFYEARDKWIRRKGASKSNSSYEQKD